MLKQILTFFMVFMTIASHANDSENILMTISDKKITKGEFEYIFFKNNDRDSITKKDLDEYIDLFINFKLKVIEAESNGMDTTQAFIKELDGYREQLAKPYLTDRKVDDFYMQEAYDHLKEEVKVSHILLEIKGSKSPADTLEAYNKLMDIREEILAGKDFNEMAKMHSIDPSAATNGGLLGYFKGFQMVYPFEAGAFNTPVGELSMPVQTQFGYHLLRVEDRRPAQGEVRVAHIMKLTPENATPEQREQLKTDIMALEAELDNGADFAELAKSSSDDYGSAKSGGELNWFSTGMMVREFEEVAFGMKEKGDVSKPFETQFGWHIVKLLDKRGVRSFNEMKEEIKRRLQRDPRGSKAFDNFIAQIKEEYNYTVHQENVDEFVDFSHRYTYRDSMFGVITRGLTKPVMTLNGVDFSQEHFADYLLRNPRGETPSEVHRVKMKWDKYLIETIVNYEKSILETKYPEFRYLMQEYHDGILLFEISSNEVWNKASEDEEKLKTYHKKVKKKYRWTEPHFTGKIIRCENDSVMDLAKAMVKKKMADSVMLKILNKLGPAITIEKGIFAKGKSDVVDYYHFEGDKYEPYMHFNSAFLSGKYFKPKAPKEFELVKGNVTSDYQNYLEKMWIKALRKKYKTSVNKDVLNSIKVKKK